ncbi:type IV pilus modification PilV family protein [Mucisphaera calidilacus]|uniref:Prepilin-type N-terminal cleavage/methylation domain-containing protein n=1 Tax=Mucisphaera calidilacus TaxID=2527982 RepID=A0A518BXF9_9BACT|nr:type II secretion system protein [Mucisphaera calidilacus]QDU71660.1 hypothetical protein Pan265_15120 [Mucisphaera calidilacus]
MKPHARHGYTLVEMLVSAGILAFGLILLAAMFPAGGLARRQAADDIFAHIHARNLLATLQAIGKDEIDDLLDDDPGFAYTTAAYFGGLAFKPLVDKLDYDNLGGDPLDFIAAGAGPDPERDHTVYRLPYLSAPQAPYRYQKTRLKRYGQNNSEIIAHYPHDDSYLIANSPIDNRFDNRYPDARSAPSRVYDHRFMIRRASAEAPFEFAVFVFRHEDANGPHNVTGTPVNADTIIINDFDGDGERDTVLFFDARYVLSDPFLEQVNLGDNTTIGDLGNASSYLLELPTSGVRNHSILMQSDAAGFPAYVTRIVGTIDDDDEIVALLDGGRPPALVDPAVGLTTANLRPHIIHWLPARTATIVTGIIP